MQSKCVAIAELARSTDEVRVLVLAQAPAPAQARALASQPADQSIDGDDCALLWRESSRLVADDYY